MRRHLLFALTMSAVSGIFAQYLTLWPSELCGLRAHADSEDKPMLNGEFHFGALDRGMFHTGLVPTGSQEERAACYAAFVESCLAHPRFVGTHWFQWRDQALTGRGDGENCQIGFLTVTDQPHPELVAASRKIGASMYQKRHGQ